MKTKKFVLVLLAMLCASLMACGGTSENSSSIQSGDGESTSSTETIDGSSSSSSGENGDSSSSGSNENGGTWGDWIPLGNK